MEPYAQFVKLVLSKSVKGGIRMKTKLWAPTPVVFAMLALLVGLVLFVACGGDSRAGSTITRYELQPSDCFNVPEESTRILLVDCSSAERLVLHNITLEDSEFEGVDWMKTKAERVCQAATEGETDQFYRPSASTWSLDDRLVVCIKKLDEGSDDDSNTGSSDDDSNTRIGTTQTIFSLEVDDCFTPDAPDYYITQCDQAERRVLKIVVIKDGPWPGDDALDRAANNFCPSRYDGHVDPTRGTWADGDREIVCFQQLTSNGTSSGSIYSVPLYDSRVTDFSKGFVRGSGSQLEAANRALDKAIDSGQQVIECQYGPSDTEAQTGYQSYGFWYEDAPDNIDELLRVASESGVPDPVAHLGHNSITSCPDSKGEGEEAWRAGR